ncbi:UNVERIFIED_CONTAM: hypothetical protein Sangu_2396100 [Sesamum angustifolium]|uniref:Uncharacterized protein n=1 Tax=Sesamum angustifolium TaxID=2727405 RepID=A0AAW2KWV4_9LAMI
MQFRLNKLGLLVPWFSRLRSAPSLPLSDGDTVDFQAGGEKFCRRKKSPSIYEVTVCSCSSSMAFSSLHRSKTPLKPAEASVLVFSFFADLKPFSA